MNKKKFKKVLIVLGGTSGERSISLESGRACALALKKRNYDVSLFDPKFNLYVYGIISEYSVLFISEKTSGDASVVSLNGIHTFINSTYLLSQ